MGRNNNGDNNHSNNNGKMIEAIKWYKVYWIVITSLFTVATVINGLI